MDITRRDATLRQIARFHFHLTDLGTRNQDALDFHSLPVWALEAALRAAYDAGHAAGAALHLKSEAPPLARTGLALDSFHRSVEAIGPTLGQLRRAADDFFSIAPDQVTWADAERVASIEATLQRLADSLGDTSPERAAAAPIA